MENSDSTPNHIRLQRVLGSSRYSLVLGRECFRGEMNVQNERVLVTGADGFIGSHLVEHLLRAGAHVIALAQYNSLTLAADSATQGPLS